MHYTFESSSQVYTVSEFLKHKLCETIYSSVLTPVSALAGFAVQKLGKG